ncbi:Uncharacterised protein [Escherichia coli]|uniref:Uncharacterized protein n=1 Tax=Escherichia coli TaxID=562 RepID=A0A377HHS2_ECOLX|nr:Uncharacterised protein [Escherichia coli]
MLGGADNPNGELPSYITGADTNYGAGFSSAHICNLINFAAFPSSNSNNE